MEVIKVLWLPIRMLTGSGRGQAGICEHAKRIFTITDRDLVPIILTDIILDNGVCEEEKRCLNIKCSFNKSTTETLKKHFGRTMDKGLFDKLPIEDHWNPELIQTIEALCVQHPRGGMLHR